MVQSLNISGIINAFRLIWNPSLAIPHLIVNDIRGINFAHLKNQEGIKAMAFDKDNCLTAPYISSIHPDFEKAWATCKATFGRDNIVIVSNSAGTPDDKDHHDKLTKQYDAYLIATTQAAKLEQSLGVPVLRHAEKKPSGGADLAAHLKGVPAHHVAMVGDRLLTDVVFGNLNGNYTIWTRQIVTEKGDNKAALVLRRMEHGLLRLLHALHVEPPSRPKY